MVLWESILDDCFLVCIFPTLHRSNLYKLLQGEIQNERFQSCMLYFLPVHRSSHVCVVVTKRTVALLGGVFEVVAARSIGCARLMRVDIAWVMLFMGVIVETIEFQGKVSICSIGFDLNPSVDQNKNDKECKCTRERRHLSFFSFQYGIFYLLMGITG